MSINDQSLINFEIKGRKEKVEKLISSFSVHMILDENERILSDSNIIQNLSESTVLLIKKIIVTINKNEDFFIIGFKNTIFIINQSLLHSFQTFFSITTNSPIYFFKDTKNTFNSIINLKNEQFEIDDQFEEEITNFNREINRYNSSLPFFNFQFCQSILSCITGYLIQEGYTKANSRLGLYDQIMQLLDDSLVQTNLIKDCTKNDYIKLRNLTTSNTTKLIYYLDKRELFVLKKQNGNNDEISSLNEREIRNYILNESHPLLPKLYGKTNDKKYLIKKFFEGQPLSNLTKTDDPSNKLINLTFEDKILIIIEIMGIIDHLQHQDFVYRDLNPSNVMINHNKIASIINFDRMVKNEDTYKYDYICDHSLISVFTAPEIEDAEITDKSIDVYSIGQMIYYIMNERIPTRKCHKTLIFEQNPKLFEIYQKCIDENSFDRPSVRTILGDISRFYVWHLLDYLKKDEKIDKNFSKIVSHPIVRRALIRYGKGLCNGIYIQTDYEKAIYCFSLASNQDDAEAQFELGRVYYDGKIQKRNNDKAINYFLLAAEKKHVDSLFYLGKIYYEEKNDVGKAIYYFSLAAEQDYVDALFNLGIIYYMNNDVRNMKKSIYYLTLAADKNDLEAQYNLGIIYYEDEKNRDIKKAIHYLTLAADKNYLDAQYNLGIIYYENKYINRNINETIKYLELASKVNHIEALYNLGIIYYNGHYVPKDLDKAFMYFFQASELNHPKSQNALGEFYLKVKKNSGKATDSFLKAANQGNHEAQLNLALIYYNGEYEKKDIHKAVDYLQLAAKRNSDAQNYLAQLYYNGEGLSQDIDQSIYYFTLAEKQNNKYAQYNLGMIYITEKYSNQYKNKGIDLLIRSSYNGHTEASFVVGFLYQEGKFIKQDFIESINYYKNASSINNNYAKNNFGVILKNGVEGIIQQNIEYARELFIEAIRHKKDSVSMYNLAHLYIFNEQMKCKIDDAIDLLINSSIQKFSPANDLLIIALIKKHGFNLDKIRQNLIEKVPESSDLPTKICQDINEKYINNMIFYEEFYQNVKITNYLYDYLHNYYASKKLQVQNELKNYKLKDLTSAFYEGFGYDI